MTTSSTSDTRDLVTLAERMGIPADEAIRLAQLIADDHLVAPVIASAAAPAVA